MVKEFEKYRYWAIVLGGSSGLGLASAKKLAKHGMNICIIHQNTRVEMEQINLDFEEIKSYGVEFLSFNADVLNEDKRLAALIQLKEKMDDLGSVRCLLHSIAKGNLKAMTKDESSTEKANGLQFDDFKITIENMAISLYSWTLDVFIQGLFAADARIISFTSEGSHKAWRNYAAVSAAKAALEAITRNIALEFATFGIRANCIQAGVTDTPSLQKIPGSDDLIKLSIQRNPFKRLTTPDDVAGMVYLLCKDEASWVSGATIPVNGGEGIC
jgi:enoyl-[acyl-carrier protein] reductase I